VLGLNALLWDFPIGGP